MNQRLEKDCYLIFSTVYSALKMEKILQKKSLKFKLVPIPREISSSCGMAILFSCSDKPIMEEILVQENIDNVDFHTLVKRKLSLWQIFFGK